MKIKDVCKQTGLTERTVRFYVEENLIRPHMSLVNGREYRDYSEQDVAELITVADLRKMFFSIDEIKEMKESPERIAEVVAAYKIRLAADADAKASIVQTLETIDVSLLYDVNSLALSLKSVSENLPLPKRDITPNFGKYDSETKEEREQEYNRYLARQERQYTMGRAIVFSIASINVIFAILSAFTDFRFFSLIIQVAMSIALFAGVTWVRYLFVIGSALSILLSFMVIAGYAAEMPWGVLLLTVIQMGFSAGSAILLLRSNAVSDFLYSQKNG